MSQDREQGCVFGIAVLLVVLFVCVGFFVGCDATYSEGYRDGYVQKFGHKGFLVKSWEGELALAGLTRRGADSKLTGVFEFSVSDPEVARKLENQNPDELVRLHYRQVLKNAKIFYSTDYRIVQVETIKHSEK